MSLSQFTPKPVDLAEFTEQPDGTLRVLLQRFGRLTIAFPNSPITIEVGVRRCKEKFFVCFVTTDLEGDDKAKARQAKLGGGFSSVTYVLLGDGTLGAVEAQPREERDGASGKAAAESDPGDAEAEPAEPLVEEEPAPTI